MSVTIDLDVDQILQSKSEQIIELRLALKETTILLTASTAAEKRLMDGIIEHKDTIQEFDGVGADWKLWKLIGEVEA